MSVGTLHDNARTSTEMTGIAEEAAACIANRDPNGASALLRPVGLHEARPVSRNASLLESAQPRPFLIGSSRGALARVGFVPRARFRPPSRGHGQNAAHPPSLDTGNDQAGPRPAN